MRAGLVASLLAAALAAAPACSNDYDKFGLIDDPDASAGGSGGSAGSSTGGSAGTSAGGTGGNTGGSAGSPCGSGQKLCGSSCVADDDPSTGCAEASCDACTVANGTAT